MICGESTFTLKEVRNILIEKGFSPDHPDFQGEFHRRFMPIDGLPGFFIDRPDFIEDQPVIQPVAASMA